MRRSPLIGLVVAALAGCGGNGGDGAPPAGGAAPAGGTTTAGDTTRAEDTTTAGGATRLHEVDAGFSLRLPDDWQAVQGAEALENELEAFGDDNPGLEAYLRTVVENDLIEFFAFDPDVENGFATNVNVIRFAVEGTPPFQEWSKDVVAEAESLPTRVGELDRSREDLPAGDALRVEYENEFRTDRGATTVATLQYVLVGDGEGYVLTFSTLPDHADAYEDVFRTAAESFRIA